MLNKVSYIMIVILVFSTLAFAEPGADDLVVIANKSVKTAALSMKELQQIFYGKLTAWPDKSGSIKAFNLKMDSPQRTFFQKKVFNKTPDDMKKYWVKKRIEGKERPAKAKKSPLMVAIMVSKVKGAIGYCFYKDIRASLKGKLIVIKIDGKESLGK